MGKNQHYVPRFLLRNFALPESERRAVELLDLQKGLFHSPAPIKNQCKKDYLYGKDQSMEKVLSGLEGHASQIIRRAIETLSTPAPGTTEWRIMLEFFAIQNSRTPVAAKTQEAFSTTIFRGMLRTRALPNTPNLTQDEIDNLRLTNKNAVLNSIEFSADAAPKLADLEDLLVTNDCDPNFALPDVGIILHNEWARGARGLGVTGYSCHGLQIILPVTPKLLWIKYDPDIYRIPKNSNLVSVRKAHDVLKLNRLAIAHSERIVYFPGDAVTRTMLSQLGAGIRAPRSETVRPLQFKRPHEDGTYIGAYYEAVDVAFDVPWMTLWPQAARIPVSQRVGKYRVSSVSLPTFSEYSEGKRPPFWDDTPEE